MTSAADRLRAADDAFIAWCASNPSQAERDARAAAVRAEDDAAYLASVEGMGDLARLDLFARQFNRTVALAVIAGDASALGRFGFCDRDDA